MYNEMLQSKKGSRYSGFQISADIQDSMLTCFPGTDVKETNYRWVGVGAATIAEDYYNVIFSSVNFTSLKSI